MFKYKNDASDRNKKNIATNSRDQLNNKHTKIINTKIKTPLSNDKRPVD